MSKNDIQSYSEQDLLNLAVFWRRLIDELEIKTRAMYYQKCEKH